MSVFLVLLLALWIRGSKVALLHLHVGKLLLGQSQPPPEARTFQTPVKVSRRDEESRRVGGDQQGSVYVQLHAVFSATEYMWCHEI